MAQNLVHTVLYHLYVDCLFSVASNITLSVELESDLNELITVEKRHPVELSLSLIKASLHLSAENSFIFVSNTTYSCYQH